MTLSLHAVSVPVYVRMLTNLSAILDKATAFAEAKKIEPKVLLDMRLAFRFGSRSFQPQVDFFNISNNDQVVNQIAAVGSSYRFPSEILATRIIRVGFSLNF